MIKKISEGIIRLFLILCIISVYIIEPMSASASSDTLGGLKQELAALKQKKAKQESEKAQTKEEISRKSNAIYKANQEIENAKLQIADAEVEIEQSEVEIERLNKETEKLLEFMQVMQSKNAYLEYATGSQSLTELIMRLRAMDQITDYNKENLEELAALIEHNKELKIELKKKQEDLEKKKVEYQQEIDSLGKNLDKIAEVTISIDSEIKILEEAVKTYTNMGCKDNESLSSCAKIVESKTWLKPFARGVVTSAWGMRYHPTQKYYTFHNGIDIGVGEGTKIYSVTNGQVVAISNSNSCGGRQLYITGLVGGKKYTVYYFHLLDIYVKVGDIVTNQTMVASTGGGAQAQKNNRNHGWAVDGCSTGPHLHLGVATGWYTIDYKNYSGIVSNNINPPGYPKVGSSFYSRTQYFN